MKFKEAIATSCDFDVVRVHRNMLTSVEVSFGMKAYSGMFSQGG